MAGEDPDDDSEGMPAYLTPPGGFPKKKEYLRPKSSTPISGDPNLPKDYNTRVKYPQCQPEILDQ